MTGVYGGLVIPPDRWFKQVWLTTFVIVIIHGRTLARVLYVLFEVPFVFPLIGMTHSRVAFDVDGGAVHDLYCLCRMLRIQRLQPRSS